MKNSLLLLVFVLMVTAGTAKEDSLTPYREGEVPDNVEDLWKDIDFREDPLETEVVKEWVEDGVVCRYVMFDLGAFKGAKSRLAAFYTFPEGGKNLPAFVWSHGGGQRAELERGKYFAKQGYAVIDINWGGREILEGIETNTDWGKVDPSQGPKFYPGALREGTKLNFLPDEHTIDPVLSPRNGNWFLLAYAGRRAITFLEQQEEVDSEKIGFTGYSMGGNITSFAAIDDRLKAAIPMVGGTGFVTQDLPGVPGSGSAASYRDHAEFFAKTMESQSYYPHVNCPVLVLSATNDFHGIFDRTFPCIEALPHDNWRTSQKIHDNHNLGPEQWILINRWFDCYVKGGGEELPATPHSELKLYGNGEAVFTVTPEMRDDFESVDVYYSHDPNARSRFWKKAEAKAAGSNWTATLPVRDGLPLFVFANAAYSLGDEFEAFQGQTDRFTLTSQLQTHFPEPLEMERLGEGDEWVNLWEDFEKNGLRDWALKRQTTLFSYKFRDPALKTPPADAKLRVRVNVPREHLSFRLRVERNKYITGVKEPRNSFGANSNPKVGENEIVLSATDFKAKDDSLPDWENIATISISIYDGAAGQNLDFSEEENLALLKSLEWLSE